MAGPERRAETGADPDAEPEQPIADAALRRRKRRDAALALPLLGLFLLASPVLDLFAAGPRPFGLPRAAVYVFVVWFALIAASARLSRRLADDEEAG